MFNVLLIEDDPMIAKTLELSLPYKGFQVKTHSSIQNGRKAFLTESFDLVLLDVNLPDGNGSDFCKEIRKTNLSIPILMVTAQTDEDSAVRSLENGADDYIRKPYGIQELSARMTRLLNVKKGDSVFYQFGSVRIDAKKRTVWVKETEMNLGKREFEIILLLVKKNGDVVTRGELLENMNDDSAADTEIYDRTIDSHLSHIRRKLKNAGALEISISPVYGVGYRIEKA